MNEDAADTHQGVKSPFSVRERFIDWVMRRHGPARREVLLDRRRIYILPTRHGYLFAVLLVVMLIGAANYANSMAFILAFLLTGLGMNAMWYTHRNLVDLRLRVGQPGPVFAGQEAFLPVTVEDTRGRHRHAVALQWQTHGLELVDVPSLATTETRLRVPTARRGAFRPGRFRVYTRYPLGLFQAWSWVEFDTPILVYPKPLGGDRPLPTTVSTHGASGEQARGSEDYSGLRPYRPGDPPRHIAWKAMAHSETLVTKEFSGEGRREIRLDWDAIPESNVELRLSVLCGWVLEAEAAGLRYALQIPGAQIPADRGDVHQKRCLRALALFGHTDR